MLCYVQLLCFGQYPGEANPVLSIVTADGTTDFATKPVAEHVSSQIATWTPNYVMPQHLIMWIAIKRLMQSCEDDYIGRRYANDDDYKEYAENADEYIIIRYL